MVKKSVATTVAGSDSGGGAGIQADLKTMEAFGVFGTSAVTSVTAQNTLGVSAVEDLPAEVVGEQIDAVADDFDPDAVKTGMLSNAGIIEVVSEKVDEHGLDLVVDPVMVAQSGDRLLDEEAEEVLRDELVPKARLVTPNVPEAEVLSGIGIDGESEMETAAKMIVGDGCDATLVKGGHIDGGSIVDVLYTSNVSKFQKERIEDGATHGTGCALSAAITAELAKGEGLHTAVGRAEEFIHRAVKFGYEMGEGDSPVHHLVGTRNEAARFDALSEVRGAVREFERENVEALVPEVGMNIAVATPYALSQDEVASVEGRITRTVDGVKANRGAWFGASGHVARFLLSLREYADVDAACNLRNNERTREVVENAYDVVRFDRGDEPEGASTMEWSAERAMEGRDEAPDAVVDGGDVGKEPMIRLLAGSADELRDMVLSINESCG